MAWDEWELLKADALARRETGMRLNSVAPEGPASGAQDLKTDDQGSKAAAEALVDLHRQTGQVGAYAEESTGTAVREFSGWQTSDGLKDAHEEWALQVKNLQNPLDKDRSSLVKAKKHFQYVDHEVRGNAAAVRITPKSDI
ncbi:hypothetical protein MTQ10_16475 [Streptomyces sp. XM83C]|uniref:hypothetical protein n=1 Tax=Streptomyces sp. XM83C TaxID=2929781 RepID=UPI001FFAE813|nr:hypothetical protein [Streptomyces sp. XM83C]MCK1821168.1 hypothetical protein [Streptomyces sp. XM83C]